MLFRKKQKNSPVQAYPDIDAESIGVLKTADEIKLDKIVSGADDEIRREVWAKISRELEKVHVGSYIAVWDSTYRKIPYKMLVDTLRQAGYKLYNTLGKPFTEEDYMMGFTLQISIPESD